MSAPWERRAYDVVREQDRTVLIVGGGPAGLATALALSRLGVAAVVVERSAYDNRRVGEHLTPAGVLQLRAFDPGFEASAGPHRRSAGVTAYWGSETANHTDYFLHPGQYGLNLSRPQFDADLAHTAEASGIRIRRGASLARAIRSNAAWQVDIDCDGGTDQVTASFVVDATGRAATFARRQGAKIHAHDRQVAVAAFWDCAELGSRTRSLVETVDNGWWYCAPVGATRIMSMLVTDDDLLPRGAANELRAWWLDQLGRTRHLSRQITEIPPSCEFVTRSARSQCLDVPFGPDWLAVGDAAMAFDPLASQGIVKALDHGRRAAAAIAAHLQGDDTSLRTHALRLKHEYTAFAATRAQYYSMERRWPASRFWRRRAPPGQATPRSDKISAPARTS
jgi:flavin-dependent dehydrogenase